MSDVRDLDGLCSCMMRISAETEGRPADWRMQHLSLVFAKLCATCISFLRLMPRSSFYAPSKDIQLWDLSSAASLCRSLIEAYYILVYVGSKSVDEESDQFCEALWEYHAAFERHEMLRVALPDSKRLPETLAILEKRRMKLQGMRPFQSLSPGHQKALLDGKDFKLSSNIELTRAAGISENYYRARYRYCSTFAHSSPFSISQLNSFRAGVPESERLLATLVGTATGYTALAIRDFVRLVPDQEAKLDAKITECISIWEETLKWEKSDWFNAPD
jgi:uncharacterized protein DUF5677